MQPIRLSQLPTAYAHLINWVTAWAQRSLTPYHCVGRAAGALTQGSNKLPFFCELHCLGSLLSSRSGIQTSGITRYANYTTLKAESEERKNLLMKVKGESEKVGLKLNIQNTKIMASSPITSWQIDGERVETVADFIFLGSKITADCDCSHEIKYAYSLDLKL